MSEGAIDDATIRHLASLAQLTLDEATLPVLRHQLATIVSYVAQLQAVDIAGADAMAHAPGTASPLRPDETRPSLPVDEALRSSPETFAGLFRVPRVLSG